MRSSVSAMVVHFSWSIARPALLALIVIGGFHSSVVACPFCIAIEPSLAQRRDAADAVLLGEAEEAGGGRQTFRVHSVFKGAKELKRHAPVKIDSEPVKPGTLAILFGTSNNESDSSDDWQWTRVAANEVLLGYFSAAPDMRQSPQKRLTYFVRYLEHPDRQIALDAYLEFAHAPYEDLLTVADKFDFAEVRRWLTNPNLPELRKGFYGVVLGTARKEVDRTENAALLKRLIIEDHADFRAGFDGVLAAWLLLRGDDGLKLLEEQFLAHTDPNAGDVRHLASALRFYYEYGPKDLREHIARTVAGFIERPDLAPTAITDLARWQHWQVVDRLEALYDKEAFADGPTRRAIVGYLKACPKDNAAAALDRIRSRDPSGVEIAEKVLLLRGTQ